MSKELEEVKHSIESHVKSGECFPNLIKHNRYDITITYNEARALLSELNRMESDIKYLLSFAPKDKAEDLPNKMGAIFYHSLTYDGDIKILERIQKMREVHNVQN